MNPGKCLQLIAGTADFFNKTKGGNFFLLFLCPISLIVYPCLSQTQSDRIISQLNKPTFTFNLI